MPNQTTPRDWIVSGRLLNGGEIVRFGCRGLDSLRIHILAVVWAGKPHISALHAPRTERHVHS
jgi:hypothetical protein